jgi:hypothetical protein
LWSLEVVDRDCDANGTSTFTVRATGPAVGPYPGTFEETATFTIGPQTAVPNTPPPGFQGPILDFHATFTIFSALGTVTGTKDVASFVGSGYGRCGDFDTPVFVGGTTLTDAHVQSAQWTTPFSYDATIRPSTGGSFAVHGTGSTNGGIDRATTTTATGGTQTAASGTFDEFFLTSGPPVALGPAAVVASPKAAVNPVGTRHEVRATVVDSAGTAVPQTRVEFVIDGASGTLEKTCTTGDDGTCSITYLGPSFPGTDTITVCADSDGDGEHDAGEPCDTATKEWVLPASTPGHATGGGEILRAGTTGTTFGFTFDGNDVVNGLKGECLVLDHAPATNRVDCLDVVAYVQDANEATVYGNARVDDGAPELFRLHVVDNGESGIGTDLFELETASGFVRAGFLTQGDIEVHPASP